MTTSTVNIPELPTGGVIAQTGAIFYDAYRELNAKKMFWVAMILSVLAIAAFGLVSVEPSSLKIAGYQMNTGIIPPKSLYKSLFNDLMVGLWLTWASAILAIVSTASIFPDFLTSGSVDLFISKPISRMRLFITKYLAGMLFVFLQVAVFAVVAFFVVGVRGKMWEPRLFWLIPIVLCFFSYLFAVSVFLGVLTRSSLAALLLTILFWVLVYGIHTSEVWLQGTINISQQEISVIDDSLRDLDSANKAHAGTAATNPVHAGSIHFAAALDVFGISNGNSKQRHDLMEQRDQQESNLKSVQFWHGLIFPVQVVVPKTTETIAKLNDMLLSRDEFQTIMESRRENAMENHRGRRVERLELGDEIDQITRARSLWWVIGSSLFFEAAVILLAGWMFCRRDF